MSLMSKALSFLSREGEPQAVAPPAPRASGYMRGNRGVVFGGWRPALRDHQDAIGEAWEAAAARAMEVIVNSGWLAGAIDQAVANTVGTGLRLKVQPENKLFGMSDAEAQAWARMVEAKFELWAGDKRECDIEGLRTFGQMQGAAYRMFFPTGEVLAELPVRRRGFSKTLTKVRVMSPHRINRDNNNMLRLVNGVYRDADGLPIGYRARKKDPILGEFDYDVAAYDAYGRQRVVHIFEGLPETNRGISPLAPALQVARQFDQLSDATLTAAIVQTLFAVTIKSEAPTEEVIEGLLTTQERAQMNREGGTTPFEAYLDAHQGYYDGSTLNVGINGRLSHLFPGDEMEFHSTNHPGTDFEAFARHLLREMSRPLGLSYSSATGDYAGSTYYTLGKSNDDEWKVVQTRRANIVAPFCQAVYEAWLEEQIEIGEVTFPGGYQAFLRNRTAACRAAWRGTPKPQADTLKAAKAWEALKRLGVVTDQMIADDMGVDIEDVYDQQVREREMRRERNLPEPAVMGAQGGAPIAPVDPEDNPDDERDDGDGAGDQ